MSDYIPTEIITDILARLPVKSVLRFTPVCKLWYVIITNPKFIATHFNQFGKTSAQLFYGAFSLEDNKNRFFILPNDENFNNNSVELDMRCTHIVGCCSGLICLLGYENDVIIWNPCLRKSVTLTLPQKLGNKYWFVIGFGFDFSKNVFKVVSIIFDEKDPSIPPDVVVYEQGINRWKGISCALLQNVWIFMSHVFLNGAVHWVAYDHGKSRSLIIAFEMDAEVFRKIPLPLDLEFLRDSLSVIQFKDSLAVSGNFNHSYRSETRTCSVWWMRNYGDFESWTKLYNIRIPILCLSQGGLYRLVGLRKNSDLLFQDDQGMLVSYEPGTETVTPTGIKGRWTAPMVVNFVESLVLLKEGKDVPVWLHNFVL